MSNKVITIELVKKVAQFYFYSKMDIPEIADILIKDGYPITAKDVQNWVTKQRLINMGYPPCYFPSRLCKHPDCYKVGNTRGYCDKHYQRLKKYGDPNFVKSPARREIKPCTADGCDREAVVKGYCQKHYHRIVKYGDASIVHRRGTRIRI